MTCATAETSTELSLFLQGKINDFLGLFKEMALVNLTCFPRRGWKDDSALCWPREGNSPESWPQGLAQSLHEGDKGSSPDPSWRLGLDNEWG